MMRACSANKNWNLLPMSVHFPGCNLTCTLLTKWVCTAIHASPKTTDMSQQNEAPIHRNEIEFNQFLNKFEGFSNEALVKEHNKLTATGIFAVGRQMRFALALHTVMKSRFPAELDGQNPAFPLNLKTTFQLVNGELKASAILP
jgi:hypothetical protein